MEFFSSTEYNPGIHQRMEAHNNNLTRHELKSIHDVLGDRSGYVLDFSNRTFSEFFEDLGISIYETWAQYESDSKGVVLRRFLSHAHEHEVVRALEALLERALTLKSTYSDEVLGKYKAIISRLRRVEVSLAPVSKVVDVLNVDYVNESASKMEKRFSEGDFRGVLTLARTLIENVLIAIQEKVKGERNDFGGDLMKLHKNVVNSLEPIKEHAVGESFEDVARGLSNIVKGLANLRNKMSDSHAPQETPKPYEARLAMNASKTIASFLIEVYADGKLQSKVESKDDGENIDFW